MKTKIAGPVTEYIGTTHPMFDAFFARGENDHPKNIWRPGYTMTVYYIPSAEDLPRVDADGKASDEWLTAIEESRWLAMKVNAAIAKDGIDRALCQAYCETINESGPCPEMCGRCFRFLLSHFAFVFFPKRFIQDLPHLSVSC